MRANPGWYPPDPERPESLRYWDGTAWTEHRHERSASSPTSTASAPDDASPTNARRAWTTWPAIAVGLVLGIVPGIVLLWLRQGTRAWVKVAATAATAPLLIASLAGAGTDRVAEPGDGAIAVAASTAPSPRPSSPAAATTEAPASASPEPDAHEPSAPGLTPDAAPPEPSPSASTATATEDDRPEHGSAYAAALSLEVKGRAPRTGYDRDEFGSGWVDVDRNGCDTRNDMLNLRLTDRVMSGRCTVLAGDLADPYTATAVHFERGGASEVDIDHLVALSDAWQKGAATWPFAQRVAFANDPLNLEPVDAGENRAKGDADAATWLPSNRDYRCHYVSRQIAVKAKYEVWVTQAELDAMLRVLDTCPAEPLPEPGDQPVIATNVGSRPAQTAPEPDVDDAAPADDATDEPTDPRYEYCSRLPADLGPYVRGEDPEYEWYRDGDGDGVVCE